MKVIEKRRQERYALNAPIKIRCYENDSALKAVAYEAQCRDISSTGVCIDTDQIQLPFMQKVHLEVTFSIEKLKELFGCSKQVTLAIDGSVVRSFKDSVIIEFAKSYSISPVGLEN
jgi:hypothetical protein